MTHLDIHLDIQPSLTALNRGLALSHPNYSFDVNTDVDSFSCFKYVNTTQSWIENLIQRVHPKTY